MADNRVPTNVKSPFTGGKCTLEKKIDTVRFRDEVISAERWFYRCVDTGRDFTDSSLDDDFMWAVFRAWCERKGFESFQDISPWNN